MEATATDGSILALFGASMLHDYIKCKCKKMKCK